MDLHVVFTILEKAYDCSKGDNLGILKLEGIVVLWYGYSWYVLSVYDIT